MPARPLRSDEEVIPFSQGARPLRPGELKDDIPPSRTGLVEEKFRKDLRKRVESEDFLLQFFLEASPATIGTAFGAAAGAPFGGVGAVPGGVLGGLIGEFIGQELGLTPQSDVGLLFAAGGPVAGRIAAPALRLGKRAIGKAVTSIPPSAAALARKTVKESVDELSSFGAKVLSKQRGIMRVPASKIYNTVRGLGIQIDPRHSFTTKALGNLENEMLKVSSFPEARQALRVIKSVKEILSQESISFSEIITSKQLIGAAVKKAEKGIGFKLRTPKSIFKAMSDDIDALAARGKGLRGSGAKLLKKANTRAKLEFSITEFEEGLAQNMKFIPEEGSAILNVNGFRNWLGSVTNPKNKKYLKNFTVALKDDLPDIMKRLAELDKISKTLSPAGPGSIVVRGIGAKTGRTIVGTAVGFGTAGPIGAAVGSLVGASMPEIMTGILLSKPGAAILTRAATMGRGVVNEESWAILGQVLGQAIKPESNVRTRGSLISPVTIQ